MFGPTPAGPARPMEEARRRGPPAASRAPSGRNARAHAARGPRRAPRGGSVRSRPSRPALTITAPTARACGAATGAGARFEAGQRGGPGHRDERAPLGIAQELPEPPEALRQPSSIPARSPRPVSARYFSSMLISVLTQSCTSSGVSRSRSACPLGARSSRTIGPPRRVPRARRHRRRPRVHPGRAARRSRRRASTRDRRSRRSDCRPPGARTSRRSRPA
jgi:hypothetical protein